MPREGSSESMGSTICMCVCVCVCGGGGGGGCEGLDPRGGPIQGEAPELQAPAAAQLATRIGPM